MKKPLILKGDDPDRYFELIEVGKPPILNIWTSGICNLECIYCATEAGEPDENELTLEELTDLVDQGKELGIATIGINGKGEPLLDPNFKPLIEHIYDQKLTTRLSTNATLINKEMAQFLYDHDVSPVVKVHGFNQKSHDHLAGTEGAYRQTKEGIVRLLIAGYGDITEDSNKKYTRLAFMTLLSKPAKEHLPQLFSYCELKNIHLVVDDIVRIGRAVDSFDELVLSPEENRKLYRTFTDTYGQQPEIWNVDSCPIMHGIFIDNQGYLRSDEHGNCCDFAPPGNFNSREASLKSMWVGLQELRRISKEKMAAEYETLRGPANQFQVCYGMAKTQADYCTGCSKKEYLPSPEL